VRIVLIIIDWVVTIAGVVLVGGLLGAGIEELVKWCKKHGHRKGNRSLAGGTDGVAFTFTGTPAWEPTEAPAEPERSPRARRGEIVAWRTWRVQTCEALPFLHLHSLNYKMCWAGPVVHADQKPEHRPFYDGGYGHGIYCQKPELHWNGKRPVVAYMDDFLIAGRACACGSVRLWGLVREHETGYRAEHAAVNDIELAARAAHSAVVWIQQR